MKCSSWIKILGILLAATILWLFLRGMGMGLGAVSPERVQGFVKSFGAWAPVMYWMIYAQPAIPIPAAAFTLAGGLAFGPVWGTILVWTGALVRAVLEFVIARCLGQRAVSALLRGRVSQLNQKLGENGFQAVLLIRLIPNLPFDVQNYGLGLSRVKFIPYFTASALGMIPATIAVVYLGYSLTDPGHIWKLIFIVLVLILVIAAQRAWRKMNRIQKSQTRKDCHSE